MAIRTGFFNSVKDDREYFAEDWARYFKKFVGNGVFAAPADGLAVLARTGLNIAVKPGDAWINGYFLTNNSDYIIALSPAESDLSRIDRIVARLDLTKRAIFLAAVNGTPSNAPTAPPITRNENIYELGLATVLIVAKSTAITAASITDTRMNDAVCGFVTGILGHISAEDLFAQFRGIFNVWFSNVQAQLGSDVAGNLLNLIDGLKAKDVAQDAMIAGKALSNQQNVSTADFIQKAIHADIWGAKKEIARFTASGNWTATASEVDVYIVGGGGGMGGYGGNYGGNPGGGGTGYAKLITKISVTKGAVYPIVIGASGVTGATNGNGTAGGASSAFGVAAAGGKGGYGGNAGGNTGGYGGQGGDGGSGGYGGDGGTGGQNGVDTSADGGTGGVGGYGGGGRNPGTAGALNSQMRGGRGAYSGNGGGTKDYQPFNPYEGKMYCDGRAFPANTIGAGGYPGIVIIYG